MQLVCECAQRYDAPKTNFSGESQTVIEMHQKTDIPTDQVQQSSSSLPDDTRGCQIMSANASYTNEATSKQPAAEANPAEKAGVLSWLVHSIPTALVFALLAGIGFWGHHHGWQIPKFSELSGNGSSEPADWCQEHGVPESACIACNADLMSKGKLVGWCQEHGVAECVLEHPEIAQLAETPVITQADRDRAVRALAVRPRPENDPTCKLHLRRIQFANREAVNKTGIDIRLVDRGSIVESLIVNAEATYDPTHVARLASRAAGTVWRVEKQVGDQVVQGEVLALIDSVDVGRAKAELLQALAQGDLASRTYDRLARLEGVVAGRRMLESEADKAQAEVAVDRAIQTLANLGLPITLEQIRNKPRAEVARQMQSLGLPRDLAAHLGQDANTGNLIPLVAPRDGVITHRDVVAGEVIDTARPLFTVVDTKQMWLMLNVPAENVEYVKVGQKVVFQPDGFHQQHSGRITWTSTEMDPEARTVKVRAELSNMDGHLLNESFGSARIVLREESQAIVVPSQAVHWEGCCHVVFVRDKDFLKPDSYKVFHTRMVRPGVIQGDFTEIIAGLLPEEVIATQGSGVLRAELLKGNLGAG
jgi:multidrug efflux pump subunit AcrA (membrane-fusion protein)